MRVPVKTSGGGVRSLRTAGSILVFGLVAFSATASEKNQGTCIIAKPVLLSENASGSATGIEIPASDPDSESTAISTADKIRSCAPQITRPPDVELDLAASIDPSVTGEPKFALAENCVLAERSFTDRTVEATCPAREVLERVWKITATCGKSAVCIQKISRVDIVAPKIVHCPGDVTVICGESTSPAETGESVATDNSCVAPKITFVDAVGPGVRPQELAITRTWTATDDCGNAASEIQVITVVDTKAPELTAPADATVGCDQPTDPASIGMATALDGCDVLPVLSFEDSISLGNSTQQGIITRVWMATDDCGNRSYATQTITVADTIAPIIESWAADERVDRFEDVPPPFHHSVVATDNWDSDIDVKWIRTLDNDTQGCVGDERIIRHVYQATDDAGNSSTCTQTITVANTTKPVFESVPEDLTVQCTEDVPVATPQLVLASDNRGDNVKITVAAKLDNFRFGCMGDEQIIEHVYRAMDQCGNSSFYTQTVTVADTIPPIIESCPEDFSVQCIEEVPFATPQLVVATDNCGDDVTVELVGTFDISNPGCHGNEWTVEYVYEASDTCGNRATCKQQIRVIDTTPPVLFGVPGDITVKSDAIPRAVQVSSSDKCTAAPVDFKEVRVESGLGENNYRLLRSWTAMDLCGNTTSATQTVAVVESDAPALAAK
jgi:hypothetical protein